MLSEPEEALLAKRANQSLRVPYQVKTNRNAQQDALISGLVSGADVWGDGNFDGIRVDGVEISSGTLQRHSKIMWFLFLLFYVARTGSDARSQVVA
ncbi:hypothetical protein ABVT39_013256 [Epinephelus coioides]